ncbi:MAG: hypothetical protein LBH66_00715 [Oscillospiraceae bacterium]|jgi:hypothetical protein|nr:hypothetical protein [Oscillospiraceae bacterium]
MSQQFVNNDGTPFTNLVNPQVYDANKNLACGWKWTCMDPCCGDTTNAWPNNRCSCCDICDSSIDENDTPPSSGGEVDTGDDGYSSEPCCYNGNCCPCKAISGDAPPLYPQSIGCGRRHVCKIIKTLPLCAEQLDEGTNGHHTDLPGRPPHTIVCVRATGAQLVQYDGDCLDINPSYIPVPAAAEYTDLNLINPDCHSYNLWVRFKIPLEVIVRDCSGYLYCLRSFLTELVRIPLTAQIHNLGNSYLYTKVRVRLCYPNPAEATTLYDESGMPLGSLYDGADQCTYIAGPTYPFFAIERIADNAFRAEDASSLARCLLELDMPDDERECHWHYTFGTHACVDRDDPAGPNLQDRCYNGNPKLDILIESCVTVMVPGEEGSSGGYLTCNRTAAVG